MAYQIIVALDIGSSYSGYAYWLESDGKVRNNRNWTDASGYESYKTPTAVLAKCDQTKVKLGARVIEAAADFAKRICKDGATLFRNFKMKLYEKKEIESALESMRFDQEGHVQVKDIFTQVMLFLRNNFMEELRRQYGSSADVPMPSIKWVLTVPALWSEKSKNKMRMSAVDSGLIADISATNLIFALKPEAASFFLRSKESNPSSKGFAQGTCYLVLDLGGGTNDMVLHEVLADGKIKELLPAYGGANGGNKINEKVIGLLERTFDCDYIADYENKKLETWFKFQNTIERFKKSIKIKDQSYTMELPLDLVEDFKGRRKPLPEGIAWNKGDDLEFSKEGIDYLFDETVVGIITDLEQMLHNKPAINLNYIFMVGGFSHSAIVVEAIRKKFERNNCKVVVPRGSQTAVMKGAVLFALHQNQVESRIARKTYGFDGSKPFDPSMHNSKYLYRDEERNLRCKDIFVSLIQKGDSIAIDHEHTHTYRIPTGLPFHKVTLYELDRQKHGIIVYVDSQDVRPVGTIMVDLPTKTSSSIKNIVIGLKFGQTEISVQAYDAATKDKLATTFEFAS